MREKDEDGKRLKSILFFIRQYLRNRKSYQDKQESVLKNNSFYAFNDGSFAVPKSLFLEL